MRILITGGSGLVGSRVVRLLSRSHEVLNLDLRAPPDTSASHLPGDILDRDTVRAAMNGIDAVVHAAAIPGPAFGVADDICLTNIEGTRRVALAAFDSGVGRFVNLSSESVLGFAFGEQKVQPMYLPVDEDHRLAPRDPYGRSKLVAEEALSDCRPDDAVVVSLRPPWVWVPEEYARCRRLTRDPESWVGGLWAYVHGDDLARAVERALVHELAPGHHCVYVVATDNGTIFRTRELIERYYSQTHVRPGIS
ncbi:MAG: NAD-dependent epimerase/dehydratase family protein, partial [Candidatus Eisenbacteria bacterium]|nr:NAD-dependent epimerase/dehydratase family protein [Candidatus Eisenbacteria bacterium]